MTNMFDILLNQLRLARKASNRTQADIALKAGISRATLSRIENLEDVRLSTVEVLARELGMTLVLVPISLVPELENFIQTGGKMVGQQAGIEAPDSVISTLLAK
jgi:transcriptional regulator with XRE-family HTH domain